MRLPGWALQGALHGEPPPSGPSAVSPTSLQPLMHSLCFCTVMLCSAGCPATQHVWQIMTQGSGRLWMGSCVAHGPGIALSCISRERPLHASPSQRHGNEGR